MDGCINENGGERKIKERLAIHKKIPAPYIDLLETSTSDEIDALTWVEIKQGHSAFDQSTTFQHPVNQVSSCEWGGEGEAEGEGRATQRKEEDV